MRLTLPFQLLLVALASTPSLASPLAAAGSDEVAAFGATDEGDSDAAVVKKRSFENSCNQCQMLASGTILSCNCRRGNGLYSQAELDLNACLANNNGQLVWAVNGGFGGSCHSNSISDADAGWLSSVCRKRDGSWVIFVLYLGNVHNWDGTLVCNW